MLLLDEELENGPDAAREARRRIDRLSAEIPNASDVTLLVSELVTNSYRHAGLTGQDTIRLRVSKSASAVRIEVLDRGQGSDPHVRDQGEYGGWGLRIVERLADRWGTERDTSGTTVWFEMRLN